jgi:aspartate/methionine/tyrosine aminotransferase
VLLLDVAYPSYGGALKVAGLDPVYLGCNRDTWLPQFDSVSAADVQRCTCLLLNYPSNPTGTLAPPGFWEEVLAFCQQHDLLLIHDAPYVLQVCASEGLRVWRCPGTTLVALGPAASVL